MNREDLRRSLKVDGQEYSYFSIKAAVDQGLGDVSKLPKTLKVLLENLLRHLDGKTVSWEDVKAMQEWLKDQCSDREIAYHPARVLMQDFTGVPAVVDLAAMRDAIQKLGGDPKKINPLSPVDLVIDHSVTADKFGTSTAFTENVDIEFERNYERYAFLRWGQSAFDNFRVVPPGTGICHQVNLEYLSQVAWTKDENGNKVAYPDTLVGTDSHTTMVNGLSVLGWGVGGIEAEAAMLGQPISMLIPEVIGFRIKGSLKEGATATDLVLTVTQMLRQKGVVGKFVEFFGDGLATLPLADRATIGNMAPEYGATCGFFPIDEETLKYLKFTGRSDETVQLVEAYAKEQGLWRDETEASYSDTLELDLSTVEPSIAGPKRPQDRIRLSEAKPAFQKTLSSVAGIQQSGAPADMMDEGGGAVPTQRNGLGRVPVKGEKHDLGHGDVVIAAITSCTNTSNPSVMLGAGLVAQKALKKGLKVKPWVKTSLAPGSQVVTDYLEKAGLQDDLDALGFNLVGYGCTTCIGNSGPLPEPIAEAVDKNNLVVSSVLSGNRNFEGRINPHVKTNYLASPPLVVAYALAGSMDVDLATEPIGEGKDGNPVYLKDIWPTSKEVQDCVLGAVTTDMFENRYSNVFQGPEQWQKIPKSGGKTYDWNNDSTYVKNPPFFEGMGQEPEALHDIKSARPLAILGDSITTDHISPAGSIKPDSPAGKYLQENGVAVKDFNSFGSRRGNHEVMMRGTFGNIRLRNEMIPEKEGGYTRYQPDDTPMSIYDAAMKYQAEGTPLVVVAGKEYGTGSSRDWAAKGTRLLGVKAVIAETYERIHRSNLVGMGVLPLQFYEGDNRKSLNIGSKDTFDILGLDDLSPQKELKAVIHREDGSSQEVSLMCRIDTENELEYFRHGGILHYVLRRIL